MTTFLRSALLLPGWMRKLTVPLVLTSALFAACGGAESYVYTARRYDPAGACLEPYAPVEVVDGTGAAATCPETCLTVGSDVFVTTMCPPIPAIATELEANADACALARAASASSCGQKPDGSAPLDGSSSEDAGRPAPLLDATTPDAGDGA